MWYWADTRDFSHCKKVQKQRSQCICFYQREGCLMSSSLCADMHRRVIEGWHLCGSAGESMTRSSDWRSMWEIYFETGLLLADKVAKYQNGCKERWWTHGLEILKRISYFWKGKAYIYILLGSCALCSWPWNLEVIYPPAHPGPWWPLRRVKITCLAFRRFLILEALCAADK